ncbi:MAG: hypothetical protein NUV49_03525 [Patescibacteria group bacterium]|nr:hypothetical protein [Patescibacteria group bacterium]
MNDTSDTTNATEIDAIINTAKARIAAKNGGTAPGESKAKRARLSTEDRAERDAKREASKAERLAARDAKRAAKQATLEANRKPAHMAKVDKAAEKLPTLTEAAQAAFDSATADLTPAEVFAVAEHFKHFVRVSRTSTALDTKLNPGDQVLIKSGNARFIGVQGTVIRSQRIRCYVEVPGYDKQVYLFTSDVSLIESAPANVVEDLAAAV